MRFTVAIGLLLAASIAGNALYYLQPCYLHDCSVADNVFVISKDQGKRAFGVNAVVRARERFELLFAPAVQKGALLMDKDIKSPPVIRFQIYWTLSFDPFKPKTLSSALSDNPLVGKITFTRPEYASVAMAQDGMTGPILGNRLEVTKHELCHVFFSSSMDGRKFSDAMDEIAAISCEAKKSLDSRLDRFRLATVTAAPVPWDRFLTMAHPIKRRHKLVGYLSNEVRKSGTSVKFNVESSSALGREIDLFYAQSAAFVAFWERKCPGQQVLQKLSISLSEGRPFSSWLVSNGLECSPRNIIEFDAAVNQMIRA